MDGTFTVHIIPTATTTSALDNNVIITVGSNYDEFFLKSPEFHGFHMRDDESFGLCPLNSFSSFLPDQIQKEKTYIYNPQVLGASSLLKGRI